MKIIDQIKRRYFRSFLDPVNDVKFLEAKILIDNIKRKGKLLNIQEAEFKVFSQFGDDGIIQYIVCRLNLPPKLRTFIEFGVADYSEANTRFLLMNNNWSGLVMDGSSENMMILKEDPIYWKYDLKSVNKFVDKKNINQVFADNGFSGDIGLLHIDIDGNDYWIWESISSIRPIILILEYNSTFGKDRSVTIPYKPKFDRTREHYSSLYWGASLKALFDLSKKKGYTFIGTNSAGNNSYFIRNYYAKHFNKVSLKEGYTESKFRESRNTLGKLTYLSGKDRLMEIKNLFVFDLKNKRNIKLSELI